MACSCPILTGGNNHSASEHPATAMSVSPDLLDRSISLLGTWAGTDKVLMIIGYSSKVVAYALLKHGQLTGTKQTAIAERFSNLSAVMSDGRTLFRFWGILPIIKLARRLASSQKPTKINAMEKVQCLMLLLFYPLEQASFLTKKNVLSLSPAKAGLAAKWALRVWGIYLALQLIHLFDDYKALERDSKEVTGASKQAEAAVDNLSSPPTDRAAELQVRRQGLYDSILRDLGYAPLAAHWNFPIGIIPNDGLVGLFGSIAAFAQLRAGWRSTQ